MEDLIERYGRPAVNRLQGMWPVLKSIDRQTNVEIEPSRALPHYTPIPMRPIGPRMVFSANSGRAGSGFLAKLLDASPSVVGGHERPPQMTGPWLRRVAFEPPHASFDARLVKVDALRGELGLMAGKHVYVDTSHMFVKTFADVVFEGVKANRFYLYSHPQALSAVEARLNAIMGQKQPPDPFSERPQIGENLRQALRGE